MITTLISFTIVIGILIFVHEFGHFIVAKRAGVCVEKFSLGFGPKLLGFQKGETHYMISAIPLGGYVKMKGEDPDETLTSNPKEFGSRSVGIRAAIVAAGSLTNFFFAFLIMPLVFIIGIQVPTFLGKVPVVAWVGEESPAMIAGIQPGDTITAVNGDAIKNWKMFNFTILTDAQQDNDVRLTLSRNTTTLEKMVALNPDSPGTEGMGIFPAMSPQIGGVLSDSPAYHADLKPGDLITAIAGTPVTHWMQMSEIIEGYPGKEIVFTVEREGSLTTATIRPDVKVVAVTKESPADRAGLLVGDTIVSINGQDVSLFTEPLYASFGASDSPDDKLTLVISREGSESTVSVLPAIQQDTGITVSGKIGVMPAPETTFKRYGVFASIKEGFLQSCEMTWLTLMTLGKLITFNISLKMLGGPIVIAKMTGSAAKTGISSLIIFMALLSLNLSIINLLPIPVLDGGHLFFLLIELIMRKPLDTKKMELVQKIGLALLILLFATVTYNDILRTVPQKYLDFLPWK
jgi:regulator of sigma E protease